MRLPRPLPASPMAALTAAMVGSVLAGSVLASTPLYCASDNTGSGSRSNSSTFQSYGSCQTHCGEDFAFGILQNHDCWCSNVAPGKNVSMKHCNSHCPGYPADNCGGSNVYAYYSIGADPTSTAAGSTSTSSSTHHTSKPSSSSSSSSSSSATTTSSSSFTTSATVSSISGNDVTVYLGRTGGGAAAATTSPSSKEASHGGGLSGGAIAGIVVGCVAGISLVGAAAIVAWIVRRREGRSLGSASRLFGNGSGSGGSGAGSIAGLNIAGAGAGAGLAAPAMKEGAYHPLTGGLMAPAFPDSRMKPEPALYPHGSRRSNISLQDDQDYSRPVLRLTNPDPDPE